MMTSVLRLPLLLHLARPHIQVTLIRGIGTGTITTTAVITATIICPLLAAPADGYGLIISPPRRIV